MAKRKSAFVDHTKFDPLVPLSLVYKLKMVNSVWVIGLYLPNDCSIVSCTVQGKSEKPCCFVIGVV